VATRVEVAAAGAAQLAAAQSGADAYVSNTVDGTVRRLDGATLAVSGEARLGHPGQPLAVYAGRQTVFAVSERSGTVAAADPRTLQPLPDRDQMSLGARISAGGAVVDGAGRLWVIDGDTGRVVRLDATGRHDIPGAVDPARTTMVLAGARVAAVDPARRTVRLLGNGGLSDPVACIDAQAGDDTARVAGSVSADRVYVASGQRGVLLVADLSDTSCNNTLINLEATDHELGIPQEAAGRVFVPDFTAGRVFVVDMATRRVEASVDVLPAQTEFELVPQGSFVFYNDPASERAGVVHLDGSWRQIRKYNPENPGEGVYSGPGPGPGGGSDTTPPSPRQPAPPPPSTRPTGQPNSSTSGVRIALSADRVAIGQPVAMRVLATGGTVVADARWNFGDGGDATGVRVRHSWTQPGVYPVRAQALLADNRQVTPTAQVTVTAEGDPSVTPTPTGTATPTEPTPPDEPPVARLAVTPRSGKTPLAVTADASASTPGSSPITGYSFDFDDGTPSVVTRPTATHTYTAARTYTVTLTVTDAAGQTDTATATVFAATPPPPRTPPTAVLTVTPNSGDAPLTTTASATGSTAGSSPITRYSFDFGDGATASGAQPTAAHTYTAARTYTVTLTVADSAGRTDTDTAAVKADEPPLTWPSPPDCISHNPANVIIKYTAPDLWQVVDGGHALLAYRRQVDAEDGLALAKSYRLHCFIGRDNTRPDRYSYIMDYWRDAVVPTPNIPNPDCLPHEPNSLYVENLGATGWRVRSSYELIEILDTKQDADDAILVMKHYNRHCYIGRGYTGADRLQYITEWFTVA
jgi:PKD repeat protein